MGRKDEIKGQAVAVFVTLVDAEASDEMKQELKLHVRKEIGALAQPDDIRFTGALPKTRMEKSCVGFCEILPKVMKPWEIPRHWKTIRFWRNYVPMTNKSTNNQL